MRERAASFVDRVNDQLHFVAGIQNRPFPAGYPASTRESGSRLRSGRKDRRRARIARQKVGFGFFAECCFNNAAPCAANALWRMPEPAETVTAGILLHGNKAGHAAAFNVGSAHQMARSPWGRPSAHLLLSSGGQNLAEMNVLKPCAKRMALPFFKFGLTSFS